MELRNIKLIAIDLDGTVLEHGKIANQFDIEMLIKASKKGIKTVISTGQGWSSARPKALLFEIDKFADLSVFSNGSIISNVREYNPIYCDSIKNELVKEFMIKMTDLNIACLAFTKIQAHVYWNGVAIEVKSLNDRNWINKYDTEKLDVYSFENYNEVVQLMIFVEKNEEIQMLNWIEKENLDERFNKMRSNVESTPIYEFINKTSNKGKGVLKLANILGINHDEIVIFGDNLNDISMFELIENSVAVGNAVDIIKQKAKYWTDTNLNGGVGKFIQKYIIEE